MVYSPQFIRNLAMEKHSSRAARVTYSSHSRRKRTSNSLRSSSESTGITPFSSNSFMHALTQSISGLSMISSYLSLEAWTFPLNSTASRPARKRTLRRLLVSVDGLEDVESVLQHVRLLEKGETRLCNFILFVHLRVKGCHARIE